MDEQDDVTLNVKAILLAVGGAALAALLLVMARRKEPESPAAQAEAVVKAKADEAGQAAASAAKDARKAAAKAAKDAKKAAKKQQKELAAAAAVVSERAGEAASALGIDTKLAERDLKAAAWDAQQEAREAESRLRATGLRVVDDAAHIASRVGAEARNLAGGGRERIAHLRHRDEQELDAAAELERLRAEIEDLKAQLGGKGRRAGRDYLGLSSRFAGKSGPVPEAMVSEAAAAALAHLERTARAKAPALMAAKNRAQVLEILQQELGPTLKETALQAASAAYERWEAARERGDEALHRTRDVASAAMDVAHGAEEEAREAARAEAERARQAAVEAEEAIARHADAARANGKRRFAWFEGRDRVQDAVAEAGGATREDVVAAAAAAESSKEDEHRGKAGLFWGGAGLGLALYALLDAERREYVLRLANEASIQVQELVRDLQGYDDEF